MKKPASKFAVGRSKSNLSIDHLCDALRPWVTRPAFINYVSSKNLEAFMQDFVCSVLENIISMSGLPVDPYLMLRSMKTRDKGKLKEYLPHLRRVQAVDRTWNFSHSSITAALQQIARDTWHKPVNPKPPNPSIANYALPRMKA